MYVTRISSIYGIFEGCLGNLEQGVWPVTFCPTQENVGVTIGGEQMNYKLNNIILVSIMNCLGRLEEGVWAVSSCLR